MADGKALKSVILYLKHRVSPETLLAIKTAEPGTMVPVEENELLAFMPLNIHIPDDTPDLKLAEDAVRSIRNRKRGKSAIPGA